MRSVSPEAFERTIRELTREINGQYPRPWMTRLEDPMNARLFIVGMNQRHGYPVARIGSHDEHIDALFNRNGRSCRGDYDRVTSGRPSPARNNIDRLTALLEQRGISGILETNAICYSTPMSADLSASEHHGGRDRGTALFRFLWDAVRPAVLIAHGEGTRRKLESMFACRLPKASREPQHVPRIEIVAGHEAVAFVIPSLAPPAYNAWAHWAPPYLERLATHAAEAMSGSAQTL